MRGCLGLGLDALQSVEVSMKSTSKHLQQGKEKQCDSYVVLQSARQPLKSPPTWQRGHGRLWRLTCEGGTCASRHKSACWKMPPGESIHIDHVLRSDLFNLTRTRCRMPPHSSLAGGGRNVMNGAPRFRPFTPVKIPTRFGCEWVF